MWTSNSRYLILQTYFNLQSRLYAKLFHVYHRYKYHLLAKAEFEPRFDFKAEGIDSRRLYFQKLARLFSRDIVNFPEMKYKCLEFYRSQSKVHFKCHT